MARFRQKAKLNVAEKVYQALRPSIVSGHQAVKIENHSVELAGVRLALAFAGIRNGRHDAKVVAFLQLVNHVKIVADAVPANFAVAFHAHGNGGVPALVELPFPIKFPNREQSPVELTRVELLKAVIEEPKVGTDGEDVGDSVKALP